MTKILFFLSREQRSEFDDIVKYLKDLGATEVVSEEFLASHKMKELLKVLYIINSIN